LLFGFLGLVVACFGADRLTKTLLQGPRDRLINRGNQLKRAIKQKENDLAKSLTVGKRLHLWQSLSLPTNPELAVSYYRSWLTELVAFAKFSNANVDAGTPLNRKDLLQTIDFSIRASATLPQITTFLYEFYNAGHLHQIRSINLTPLPRSNELNVAISVQAMILPGADRKDRLSTLRANRLAMSDLADYAWIADRNLFGFTGQGVHPTDQTFLTAVVEVDDQPQAWFTMRTTDHIMKLTKGAPLNVGQFQGTIQAIEGHDVVVESDGERWLLTVGESLAQALALPPEY
jgi:hypothetical protein